MVFNETSSPYSGIIQNIERESGLGLGTVSGNASPDYYLAYFLGKVNEWVHIVNHWIHQINDEAIFDDTNNTADIPKVYDLTASTQTYTLESNITKIRKVECRDAVSADYYDLDYYYEVDRVENLYDQGTGKPSKYFIQGRKLIFDLKADITKADKYRITYDNQAHEFIIGDTTATPGFDKQFHPILVYAPVMDWAMTRYPEIFNKCRLKVFGAGEGDPNSLKTMLQDHYKKQVKDIKYQIKRKNINYS